MTKLQFLLWNSLETERSNVLTTNNMCTRFVVFLVLLFQAVNASTICLANKGSACGSSTTCKAPISGAYGYANQTSGYIEMYGLCNARSAGIPLNILGTNWANINISIVAEYTDNLHIQFLDQSNSHVFNLQFAAYSGTTPLVQSSSGKITYYQCQKVPSGTPQSQLVMLENLGSNNIQVKMYFEGTQVLCDKFSSTLPYSFFFTNWLNKVTISSFVVTGTPTNAPTSSPTLRPTTSPTTSPVSPTLSPLKPTTSPTTSPLKHTKWIGWRKEATKRNWQKKKKKVVHTKGFVFRWICFVPRKIRLKYVKLIIGCFQQW